MISVDTIKDKTLTATSHYSGFELAHDTYNAITAASDGRIYYVLSSESYDKGGQICAYDPNKNQSVLLADLTEICGEKGKATIPQGKSHVRFHESDGKLYFASHIGVYEMIDGMERLHVHALEGYKLYPGGHFLSYDLHSGKFEDLAIAPNGEGIITMTMDKERKQLYALTWPTGYFIHYNIDTGELKNLGATCARSEAGTPGDDYRAICRSMFIDQDKGDVYFSTAEGAIYSYHPDAAALEKMEGVNLKIDYFGTYDPTRPGSMGYNWRKIFWYAPEKVAYGVHGNSGYLFRFDPAGKKVEIVDRIASALSQQSGMYDQFSYGYLGFILGPDGETIYYLTGGPVYEGGKRVTGASQISKGGAKGIENLHVVTYHLPTRTYTDHGAVFYADGGRPTYVNSIAIDTAGNIYTLARFNHAGNEIQDLVKIPNPFC
ncbi:hypothetical protein [Chitinophaga sp. MM2321]|uniref:hypothetical protein n=1 Tax=Chitinophaga sp. MM2321 TaxID=3137178 RepID=UPI0032D596A9